VLSELFADTATFVDLRVRRRNRVLINDSRTAVLEKLGRYKDALKDARVVIELSPDSYKVDVYLLSTLYTYEILI
jgi:hypothetical protein